MISSDTATPGVNNHLTTCGEDRAASVQLLGRYAMCHAFCAHGYLIMLCNDSDVMHNVNEVYVFHVVLINYDIKINNNM